MSYHQIEELVEDSICLVDKASLSKGEKRKLIYNLYRFHDKFDTDYNRFRILPALQKNGFIYTFPIKKHPDYSEHKEYFNQFDENSQEWIPVNINEAEQGSVYLKEKQLWFEVNDEFWHRMQSQLSEKDQQSPQKMTMPRLFLFILNLSFQHRDFLLTKRWYATFVNSILEFDLDENDGIPKAFNLWLKDDDLLKIRKFFEENQSVFSVKDSTYSNDDVLSIPKWSERLEFAKKPNERAILQFLLDTKTSLIDIEKRYIKEIDDQPDLTKYSLIYDFFRKKLDEQWQDGIKEIKKNNEKGTITFLRKYKNEDIGPEEIYNCLILRYNTEVNLLSLEIGIQNTRILKWQNRQESSLPELQHFIEGLVYYCNEKEIEHDNNISNWGAWKYDIKDTHKTLTRRLDSLWYYFEKHYSDVNEFYCSSLSKWLNISDSKKIIKKHRKLMNKGVRFFVNEMDFKLFIAALNVENKNHKTAKKYMKEIEDLLSQRPGSKQLNKRIKQGVDFLNKGEGTYPEILTSASI